MKETTILSEQKADLFNVTVTCGLKSLRETSKKFVRGKGAKTVFENKMNSSCHNMHIYKGALKGSRPNNEKRKF
jgi:hypothetical protein